MITESYGSHIWQQMFEGDWLEWDAFRNEASHAITFKFAERYETVQPGEIVMIPKELKYIVAKRGLPFVEVDVTFAYPENEVPLAHPQEEVETSVLEALAGIEPRVTKRNGDVRKTSKAKRK